MKRSALLLASSRRLDRRGVLRRLPAWRTPTSPAYKPDVRHRVPVPHPAVSAAYTLRDGDLVSVPAVKLWCDVERVNQFESNGGPLHPIVQCQRTAPTPGQQYVVFLRNHIRVWKVGHAEHPAWSGKR